MLMLRRGKVKVEELVAFRRMAVGLGWAKDLRRLFVGIAKLKVQL